MEFKFGFPWIYIIIILKKRVFCFGDFVTKCLSDGTEEVIHRFCYVSNGRYLLSVDVYGQNVGSFGFLV